MFKSVFNFVRREKQIKMRITSKKAFIEKVNEGYRLEKFKEYKRTLYIFCKRGFPEITVAISLIKKLEDEGIIDGNWDVRLP